MELQFIISTNFWQWQGIYQTSGYAFRGSIWGMVQEQTVMIQSLLRINVFQINLTPESVLQVVDAAHHPSFSQYVLKLSQQHEEPL